MAVYEESTDDAEKEKSTRLPQITTGETLGVKEIRPEQHYTVFFVFDGYLPDYGNGGSFGYRACPPDHTAFRPRSGR